MEHPKNVRLLELLAVRNNVKCQVARVLADNGELFTKKQHHFTGRIKTFFPSGENATPKVEDKLDIQTTVSAELVALAPFLSNGVDISVQLAKGNAKAVADIVTEDGVTLAKEVPAVALLEIEKSVMQVRDLVGKIPTLDPAKGFTPDTAAGAGIYRARPVEKVRTQKTNKVVVLHPGSDKHPAQTQLVPFDEPVGQITEEEWSSLWTPAYKATTLARIDALLRAVIAARMRANLMVVDTSEKPGEALVKYALGV